MIRRLAGVGPRWLAWTVLVVASLLFMGSAAFAAWGPGRPSLPAGGTGPPGARASRSHHGIFQSGWWHPASGVQASRSDGWGFWSWLGRRRAWRHDG